MTVIKVEFSQRAELLRLDTGQTWHSFPITFSIPGSPQALVTLPDDLTESGISFVINGYAYELVDDGNGPPEHPLWRYEHTYRLMGFTDLVGHGALADGSAVSDTFKLHGVSDDVWKRGKGGEATLIAIIDTGVDSRHAAFAGVEVIGDGKDRDGHGHGTHVASTAASSWGIASKARILALKGLEDDGNGSESQIANHIRNAANVGAHVINLSLGGNPSQVMDDACDWAKRQGAIVVCAAGNAGSAPIGSPARAADLIVMAHDRGRAWASFTQGRGWANPNRVGFNGVGIQAAQAGSQNGVTSMSGTSMATPHAAGCVALLRAAGVGRTETLAYLLGHSKTPPDGPGSSIMALDFGEVVAPPPPPEPPTPEEWVHAIDLSYAEVSLAQAQALYAQGFRLAIQCLLAAPPGAFDQPRYRVQNLRNFVEAGFMVAGYLSLRPEASGGIAVDKAFVSIPSDLWARLAFVAPDLEIPGLTLNHCLQALARLHGLGKHVEVIYTNYKSWHDDMGDPPGPSLSKLWNASWDNDSDIDFLRLPFGGWTLERLAGEQYQGSTVVEGVEVDLNVFRKSFLPGVPTPPPPPPPPPPPSPLPGLVVAGIGVRFTDGTERQLWP